MALYKFVIHKNDFLKQNLYGYYSTDFISYAMSGQLSFLHRLKNRFSNERESVLNDAKNKARDYIVEFLENFNNIIEITNDYIEKKEPERGLQIYKGIRRIRFIDKFKEIDENIIVCRIPRSKVDFKENQLYFQKAVKEAIEIANKRSNNKLIDGINYIKRTESVETTHLNDGQGKKPYPNITKDTCEISDKIANQTIILIDDIYTSWVNVVEDCIQALYDKGAKQVIFYAVGRTVKKSNTESVKILSNECKKENN